MTDNDWTDTDIDIKEEIVDVLRKIERSLFWLSLAARLFWYSWLFLIFVFSVVALLILTKLRIFT